MKQYRKGNVLVTKITKVSAHTELDGSGIPRRGRCQDIWICGWSLRDRTASEQRDLRTSVGGRIFLENDWRIVWSTLCAIVGRLSCLARRSLRLPSNRASGSFPRVECAHSSHLQGSSYLTSTSTRYLNHPFFNLLHVWWCDRVWSRKINVCEGRKWCVSGISSKEWGWIK